MDPRCIMKLIPIVILKAIRVGSNLDPRHSLILAPHLPPANPSEFPIHVYFLLVCFHWVSFLVDLVFGFSFPFV